MNSLQDVDRYPNCYGKYMRKTVGDEDESTLI